jgi:hypothetical protein
LDARRSRTRIAPGRLHRPICPSQTPEDPPFPRGTFLKFACAAPGLTIYIFTCIAAFLRGLGEA